MAATGRRALAGSCLEVGAWGHTIQTSDSIPFASRRKGWNTRPRSGGTPLIDGCCSRFFPTSVWQSPTWIVHFLRWSLHCLRPKFWPGRPCGVPVRSPQPSGCNPTRSLRTSSAFSTSGSPNCSFSSPRSWDGCLTSSVHVGRPSTLPTSLRKRGGGRWDGAHLPMRGQVRLVSWSPRKACPVITVAFLPGQKEACAAPSELTDRKHPFGRRLIGLLRHGAGAGAGAWPVGRECWGKEYDEAA